MGSSSRVPPYARRRLSRWTKRAFDVAGAGTALVALAPVMGVVAVAIRRDMGSPVLFRQERPGFKGRPFTLRKFRTMRAPRPGEDALRSDADRVTRLGAFLRRTSLDELPELWNVLVGEMSLVGPRPLLMEYLERYTAREMQRHEMPPGLTGLAQIRDRHRQRFSQKLAADLEYIDEWSLRLDLKILLQTFGVLTGGGELDAESLEDADDLGLTGTAPRKVDDGA